MKFNLYTPGTRVIYTGDTKSYSPMAKGERGTVVMVLRGEWGRYEDAYTYELGVDWDEPSENKHDCEGAARDNHGWWVFNGDVIFEPKKEPKKKRGKSS